MLKKILPLCFIAAVGAFLYIKLFLPDANLPQSVETAAIPIKRTEITALGKIEPKGGIMKIAAPHEYGPSIVKKLYIGEGDRVEKGQTVAVLNNFDRLQAIMLESKAKMESANVRLELAEEELESPDIAAQRALIQKLKIELEYAEKDFDRVSRLKGEKIVSPADFDRYSVRRRVKMQELSALRNELKHMTDSRRREIRMRKIEIAEAESTMLRTKEELALATVESPITGVVLEVFAHEGEIVNQTDGIANIGNTDEMYVCAEVFSTDILLVKPGQQAVVSADQIGLELSGEVERVGRYVRRNRIISADPSVDADARVVEVRIRLIDGRRASALTNLQVTCGIRL